MVVWAETIEKHTLLFIFLTTPGPGSLDTKNARPKGLTIFVAGVQGREYNFSR